MQPTPFARVGPPVVESPGDRCQVARPMTSDGGQRVDESSGLHEPPVASVQERGDAIVVDLAGELDLYNAHLAREALLGAASRSPERLVVVLSEVTFIDSTGLGVLVETRTRLANRRAFLLVAPGVETRRALEISGLDRHFALHDTLEGALSAEV
jgi:anti-sigma B factor antagonist